MSGITNTLILLVTIIMSNDKKDKASSAELSSNHRLFNDILRYVLLGACLVFLAMTVVLGGVTGIYQFFLDNFF